VQFVYKTLLEFNLIINLIIDNFNYSSHKTNISNAIKINPAPRFSLDSNKIFDIPVKQLSKTLQRNSNSDKNVVKDFKDVGASNISNKSNKTDIDYKNVIKIKPIRKNLRKSNTSNTTTKNFGDKLKQILSDY